MEWLWRAAQSLATRLTLLGLCSRLIQIRVFRFRSLSWRTGEAFPSLRRQKTLICGLVFPWARKKDSNCTGITWSYVTHHSDILICSKNTKISTWSWQAHTRSYMSRKCTVIRRQYTLKSSLHSTMIKYQMICLCKLFTSLVNNEDIGSEETKSINTEKMLNSDLDGQSVR